MLYAIKVILYAVYKFILLCITNTDTEADNLREHPIDADTNCERVKHIATQPITIPIVKTLGKNTLVQVLKYAVQHIIHYS